MDFVILFSWILLTIAISMVGNEREIGAAASCITCIFLTPLIGGILTFCSEPKEVIKHREELVKNQQRIIDLLEKQQR